MLGLDVLANAAMLLYLASYSVRNILVLRVLTVLGIVMLMPYYYLQPVTLWTAIAWNIVFAIINVFWIVKLLAERRPVTFSEDEGRVYEHALSNVKDHDARKLFRHGLWITVPSGTSLQTQGEPVDVLMLVSSGKLVLKRDGIVVDTIDNIRFLGEGRCFSQDFDYLAPVTIETLETTRMIRWHFSDVGDELDADANFKADVEAAIGLHLSRTLISAYNHLHNILPAQIAAAESAA